MPEGDTIHRLAARLRPALVGAPLVRFEARRAARPWPVPGTVIEAVDANGKHLLVRFGDGRVLHTHLGMTGSWHLTTPGARWPKPARLARVVLEVPDRVAVCFAAPTVRLLPAARAAAVVTAHLGPDLCTLSGSTRAGGIEEALRRMASVPEPDTEIADVLLDQRVAAGIGNVYKSEVLWACRLWPFTPIGDVPESVRRLLLETATDLLQANLGPGRRTVPGGLAVYGRARRPCRRCGAPAVPALRRAGAHPTIGTPGAHHRLVRRLPTGASARLRRPPEPTTGAGRRTAWPVRGRRRDGRCRLVAAGPRPGERGP